MILAMLLLLVMMINEFRHTGLSFSTRFLLSRSNNIFISSNLDGVNDLGDVTLACDDDKRIQAHGPELLHQVLALQVPDLDGGPGGRAQPVPADGQA